MLRDHEELLGSPPASRPDVRSVASATGMRATPRRSGCLKMAAELGPKGIRVHAISPGRLATRAASGIPEFDELLAKAKVKAPARSLVT
jgi:enoyl-[acyl-carrier protein] reductase I